MATRNGVVPGFKYDLLISYAHDNDVEKWVTRFIQDLENRLRQQLPDWPAIWWDSTGLRGRNLDPGIDEAVRNSAVIVPILSKAFFRSAYCGPQELNPFMAYQHEAFPFAFESFVRMVAVGYDAEEDCPRASWPDAVQNAPFASFCERVSGDRVQYSRADSPSQYKKRIGRVADHIQAILERMRQGPSGKQVASPLAPSVPVAKPRQAWQQRWSRPLVYVRYRDVDKPMADSIARRISSEQCDVTCLESAAGERALEAYLKQTDVEVLVFGCGVTDWAHTEWLRCRDIARDGRPKRLGVLASGDCMDQLGISSEFVVPLQLDPSGRILGLDRLLEGLR
jgi:hypothetical protein